MQTTINNAPAWIRHWKPHRLLSQREAYITIACDHWRKYFQHGMVHSTQWSQILAQNRDFCLPHIHLTPSLVGFPSEYCHAVWCKKFWRYVYSFWQNVRTWRTHRQTDGQTPHDDIGRACIASRGNNKVDVVLTTNTLLILLRLSSVQYTQPKHCQKLLAVEIARNRVYPFIFDSVNIEVDAPWYSIICKQVMHGATSLVLECCHLENLVAWSYSVHLSVRPPRCRSRSCILSKRICIFHCRVAIPF